MDTETVRKVLNRDAVVAALVRLCNASNSRFSDNIDPKGWDALITAGLALNQTGGQLDLRLNRANDSGCAV